MNRTAFQQAKTALRQVQSSRDTILADAPPMIIEEHWALLVQSADLVFEKIGAAMETPEEKAWFVRERDWRKQDPLLQYAHQARNAFYHGAAQITEVGRGSGLAEDGTIVSREPRVRLLPVKSRGVEYPPPREHHGHPLRSDTIQEVAMLLEMSLRALVQQAWFNATGETP